MNASILLQMAFGRFPGRAIINDASMNILVLAFAAHLYEILLDDTYKHLTLTDTAKQFSECLIYILPAT